MSADTPRYRMVDGKLTPVIYTDDEDEVTRPQHKPPAISEPKQIIALLKQILVELQEISRNTGARQ